MEKVYINRSRRSWKDSDLIKEDRRILGNVLLILTAMIWGTAFVFQRTGMDSIEPITFNAARMLLAAVAVGMVSAVPTASEKQKLAGFSREQADAYRKDNKRKFGFGSPLQALR